MKLYGFSGSDGVYGLTKDPTGGNLPPNMGPWKPFKDIDIEAADKGRIGIKPETVLADIAAHGYHVTKIDISMESKG